MEEIDHSKPYSMPNNCEASVVAALAEQAMFEGGVQVHEAGGIPTVAIPCSMQTIDLEQFSEITRRKTGSTQLAVLESFLIYVNKHGDAHSLVIANHNHRDITAILNAHRGDYGRHGDHTCTLDLEYSDDYQAVLKIHDKALTQDQFCDWIEDNAHFITRPDYSTLLELTRTLAVTKSDAYTTEIDITNGSTRVKIDTAQSIKSGKGEIEFPREMIIAAPIFYGEGRAEVKMRLRVRFIKGTLVIHTAIIAKQVLEDSALQSLIDSINAGIAEIQCPPVLIR